MKTAPVGAVLSAALVAAVASAMAGTRVLSPELSGLSFLVGNWASGIGKVADTGQTSRGSSVITAEANGAVLLRRDHTDLFDAKGKPAGGFDQIMMIYPDRGALRADYSDGTHVIHYSSATVMPGHSVVFVSQEQPGAPTFKLTYEFKPEDDLHVSFEMAAPGQHQFKPVASGTLKKSR